MSKVCLKMTKNSFSFFTLLFNIKIFHEKCKVSFSPRSNLRWLLGLNFWTISWLNQLLINFFLSKFVVRICIVTIILIKNGSDLIQKFWNRLKKIKNIYILLENVQIQDDLINNRQNRPKNQSVLTILTDFNNMSSFFIVLLTF